MPKNQSERLVGRSPSRENRHRDSSHQEVPQPSAVVDPMQFRAMQGKVDKIFEFMQTLGSAAPPNRAIPPYAPTHTKDDPWTEDPKARWSDLRGERSERMRWREKMKTQSNKRNQDKYCEFHKDHDHDMENCFDLYNHIEDLIRRGYLSGFIDRKEKPAQEEQREDEAGQPPSRGPPAGVIHIISGGVAARGESSSGRKRYSRLCEIDDRGHGRRRDTSITFIDNDLRGVQTPHDDAFVVTVKVANFELRWILFDIGSSADVLFEEAFEKLGIDR
ncbi:PREDICTED: uncharacterized protein LOC104601929 [Nelumbo nucifera]|uniref:Uncharacterized protein LOC104601929 n=1 Tax=Nelumbo nucifera TaxID=4432 RepID=A0A1U8ADY1_NELNU|nr:PREDICTED: uncharacterized protein LOC104601929 [Nelumbo nucifera]